MTGLFSIFLISSAFALSIPEKPQGYVSDYARLLSSSARQKLESDLLQFEKETSNQIVVAIFESLDGGSLEDFSIRLAEKWKIGSKKNDNGVILLIFKNDRQVRIEVGYGLEGALPDITADQIIRREIVPAFREGDFDGGVTNAVSAIIQATRGEYKASADDAGDKIKPYSPYIFILLVLYLAAPFICYAMLLVFGTIFFGFPTGFLMGLATAFILMIFRKILFSSFFGETLRGSGRGFGGHGGGGFGGGSFGGGGFGGGGGGNFGGGGASGRW